MPPKRRRMLGDVNKFSVSQMLSNSDGKTSASGTMGVFICLIGGVSFFIGAMALIFKGTDSDILVQSISLVYAGALLLGYRKSADRESSGYDDYNDPTYGNEGFNRYPDAAQQSESPIMSEEPIQPEEPIGPEEPILPEEPVYQDSQNKPRRRKKDVQLNS